ncbi:MAG TPA: hypothetical protein VHW69_15745 [Rhizomicrobium sp.]|jgi:hypothetical protein|nr:hypothetical protein [Rhizomicrobium sp.]
MNLKTLVLTSVAVSLAVVAVSGPASAKKQKLDAGLFTTYSGGGASISYVVCGSLPQSSGCYGSGSPSPFEQACAVLEGKAKQKNNVITRAIYVLDKRTSASAAITLSVYTRTDTITDTSDSIQVSLTKTVSLGLNGGASSHCSMAANNDFVYAATDADTVAAGMNKSTYAVSELGGFSPPANIVSITTDDRGYVSLHFNGGFYVYGPDGSLQEDGGGAADMVGTHNAWVPK